MCMIFECEMEKKPIIGWKVVETNSLRREEEYATPYVYMPIKIGHQYESNKLDPAENIYVFLNKIYAKKFLKWMAKTFGESFCGLDNFHLAKIKLGDHIWKGKVDPSDGFEDLEIEYFFTTDSIEVLEIE